MSSARADARLGRWSVAVGVLAFLLAAGASVFLLVAPTGSSSSASSAISSDGTVTVEPVPTRQVTLLEENGRRVLIALAVPVVLSGAGAVLSLLRRCWPGHLAVAGVLLAGCLLGAMSIGLLYLPAAAATMVSAALSGGRAPRARALPDGASRSGGNGGPVVR